jgi:hypothetical protein
LSKNLLIFFNCHWNIFIIEELSRSIFIDKISESYPISIGYILDGFPVSEKDVNNLICHEYSESDFAKRFHFLNGNLKKNDFIFLIIRNIK